MSKTSTIAGVPVVAIKYRGHPIREHYRDKGWKFACSLCPNSEHTAGEGCSGCIENPGPDYVWVPIELWAIMRVGGDLPPESETK